MTKQILVHVGLPKTGTTYLQRCVFPKLPNVFTVGRSTPNHNVVFDELEHRIRVQNIAQFDFELEQRRLAKEIDDANESTILWSREGFFGTAMANLRDFTLQLEVINRLLPSAKVFIVLRRQSDWLESLYRQSLMVGASWSIDEFLNYKSGQFRGCDEGLMLGLDVRGLDWSGFIQRYIDTCGVNRVLVLPYEMLRSDPLRFLNSLASFADIPLFRVSPANVEQNTSLNVRSASLLRNVNRLYRRRPPKRLVDFLKRYGRNLGGSPFVTAAQEKQINDLHRESNTKLSTKINIDLSEYRYY